jgi:hypothetical protein
VAGEGRRPRFPFPLCLKKEVAMATIDSALQIRRVWNLYARFMQSDRSVAIKRTRGARWAFAVQTLLVASLLADLLAPR